MAKNGEFPMRLEVFCEDRLGLTRELLDLLVLRSIDLRGIEIDPVGRIYLNFAEIEFNTFSSLMGKSAVSLALRMSVPSPGCRQSVSTWR